MIFLEPQSKFNCAIIGYEKNQVVYSIDKLIDIIDKPELGYNEILDYIYFNFDVGIILK